MAQALPVDISRLRKTFDDDSVLAELYTMFLRDAAERLAGLRTALADKDIQRCSRVSHAIKGSSGNIGANAMYELAATLETHDWDANPGEGAVLSAQLEAEFARVEAWIKNFLTTVPAAR